MISKLRRGSVLQHVGGSLSVQRSVGSVGEPFDVQDLVSEMKMFLHGLGQAGSWFLNKMVCRSWGCFAKVET